MAKNNVATVPENKLALTTDELLDQYSGQGVSKAQEDNLVPLIYILQKQSPQVEKRDPRYVEGAEPADIWLRNAPNPIVKGEQGILFQPCYFTVDWVEWVPRDKGGGFVTRYPEPPADVSKRVDPQNPNRIKYLRPNGNEVMQTRNHVGYVQTGDGGTPMPFVIPMTSSGHTVSRQWMTDMNRKTTASGKTAPSFGYWYRLKTVMRQNQLGAWYTWEVKEEGRASDDDVRRGAELFMAFDAGTKQVEIPVSNNEDDSTKPM